MSKQINQIYEFGEFRLETAERLLLRNGKRISLTPKEFETLLVLVKRAGHAVEKTEFMNQVWTDDDFVEPANLPRNIYELRKKLGDGNGEHNFIETIPKLGYRFMAPVTELLGEDRGLLIQRRVRAHVVVEETETSEPPLALPPKPRSLVRPITFSVLVLVGLTAVGLAWFWRRPKPTIAATVPTTNFLTDGRFDDSGAYFTNQGQIYFVRYVTNTRAESWTMNADGSNQHRANTEIKSLLNGRWSPDGKKVLFRKEGDNKPFYIANADGTNEITLLFDVGYMDWSPDGSQFVYQGRNSGTSDQEIFLYTLKTRRSVNLTNNDTFDADPSFAPDGKQIAFVSDRDGNAEIYVMQTDGSNVRRLTNHPAFDNYPVFSPDGTQIAFQSNREDEHVEVYLQNVNDQTPPKRITHSNSNTGLIPKSWSPDGTQILFYTNQIGTDQIFLANVESFPARLVLSDPAADLNEPRVSADGKQILYQARLADRSLELRVADLDSKSTRTLFKTARDHPIAQLTPAWSPDNSLIAFSYRATGNSEIFTIKSDGSQLKNLTNNPLLDTTPIFSADGTEIIFGRDTYGQTQLYRMDLNGGNQRRVTEKKGYEMTPAFSPGGAYLAFAGDREGHGLEIFLLDFKNPKDEKLLVARRFHDTVPAFSPDGRKMAFIATSDGNQEIYVIKSDGTGLYRLTHSKTQEISPQFTKDGKALVFAANHSGRFAIYEIALP